jgi:hypothetical protein
MSFLGFLQSAAVKNTINGIALIAPMVESIPTIGPLFATIFQFVINMESVITQPNMGSVKQAGVVAMTQTVFPDVDPTVIKNTTNQIVSSLNTLTTASQAGK